MPADEWEASSACLGCCRREGIHKGLVSVEGHICAGLLVPHDQEEGAEGHAGIDLDDVVEHALG